jgi:uncharacterized protein YneF (UPF0154 family)
MKKLFMVVVLVLALVGGVCAGIGFAAGRQTNEEITVTEPTDEDLVRELVVEDRGDGEYEIVITDDQGDGYIDYFVYDEDGNVIMCGYTNRDVRLKQWYETH